MTTTQTEVEPTDLVPVRMLNEFVYCPRLAYLEWVQGEFRDNRETIEGRDAHRRVDRPSGDLDPDVDETLETRSLTLSAPKVGLIARMDLLRGDPGGCVVPIDFKRGRRPDSGAWPPERVQVCAQGIILRENGFRSDHGELYFVASKQRERVDFDDRLIEQTLAALRSLRRVAADGTIPDPLADSPKCPRCSLVGICLPDEVGLTARHAPRAQARRLYPARVDAVPVYVRQRGAFVGKRGDRLSVKRKGTELDSIRLLDVSQLALFGNITLSSAVIRELCERRIPVCHFSFGGWFFGITRGFPGKNIELRRAQFRAADDDARCTALARKIVATKIRNTRTLLMRNRPGLDDAVPAELMRLFRKASRARRIDSLLGLEGSAARVYFAQFSDMLKPPRDGLGQFEFRHRNRRPPTDPVNAMLSFAYALLTKELTIAIASVGLDPYLGFFHQPRYGRPSLALDLMEAFRPLIADSAVITAINNGEVLPTDFITRGGATSLNADGRRKLIAAFERRMDTLITHPVFKYRVSYRQTLELQTRLLGRFLTGEIAEYPDFRTR